MWSNRTWIKRGHNPAINSHAQLVPAWMSCPESIFIGGARHNLHMLNPFCEDQALRLGVRWTHVERPWPASHVASFYSLHQTCVLGLFDGSSSVSSNTPMYFRCSHCKELFLILKSSSVWGIFLQVNTYRWSKNIKH